MTPPSPKFEEELAQWRKWFAENASHWNNVVDVEAELRASDDGEKMVKVHKLTVLVVDHDNLGAYGVKAEMENARYANHCMVPEVMACESVEVEWSDEHPLNQYATMEDEFARLFKVDG